MMYEYTTRKVSDLTEYANNSRTHSDEQIDQIAKSIEAFGFTNPILIDEHNGIIAGHGRLMGANKLGMDEVPCVIMSGLTEAQKKAYVIADNQLALNAGWDLDILRFEVEALNELDFDLTLLGFDSDVLDKLTDIDAALPEMNDGDRDPFQQKIFMLHDEQAATVDDAITLARTSPLSDTGINENSNGNAISLICDEWLRFKNGDS